jgi:hypothetical protein
MTLKINSKKDKQEAAEKTEEVAQVEQTPVTTTDEQIQPPPQVQQQSSKDEYNPLNEPTIERGYSKAEIYSGQAPPLPESTINPQSPEEIMAETTDDFMSENGEIQDEEPMFENPEMADLSNKDKKNASGYLAKMLVGLYEQMHTIGYQIANFDDDKIQRKILKGEFDPEILEGTIQTGEGFISFKGFLNEYNTKLRFSLTLDPEVKEEMIQVLTRIGVKHNWGLNDEQYFFFLLFNDMTPKITTIVSLKSTLNDVIKILKKQLDDRTRTNVPSQQDYKEAGE